LYLFEALIKKKGNVIADHKTIEFKKIKKISLNKKLKLYTLYDKKNNFEVISHGFRGEFQFLKIKYNNLIRDIN